MKLDASWYADKEWRGFVLHDARRDLEDRHVFVTRVAGISHYPAAVDRPDFAPGNVSSSAPSRITVRSQGDRRRNASGTVQVGHLPAVIVRDLPSEPEERHGLMVGELVHGRDRVGLWVVVAREPVVLRVVTNLNDSPPTAAAAWVRQTKAAVRRSAEKKGLHSVGPIAQIEQMAASLKKSA